MTVGFTASSYSTSEADDVVEVCVTLLSGYLGTDITLQLDTHNGTAEGTYLHMQVLFVHLSSILYVLFFLQKGQIIHDYLLL